MVTLRSLSAHKIRRIFRPRASLRWLQEGVPWCHWTRTRLQQYYVVARRYVAGNCCVGVAIGHPWQSGISNKLKPVRWKNESNWTLESGSTKRAGSILVTNTVGQSSNLFDGFGEAVFSPDSTVVALSATDQLDFVREVAPQDNDQRNQRRKTWIRFDVYSVVGFDVRSLHQTFRVEVPERVDSLAWSRGGRLVVCTGGKVAVVEPKSSQLVALPFHATICRSHPSTEWCAFASQQQPWTKTDPDERLVVRDLTDFKQVTEQPGVGGIYDMAWSSDGKALLAISSKGEFWECDFAAF